MLGERGEEALPGHLGVAVDAGGRLGNSARHRLLGGPGQFIAGKLGDLLGAGAGPGHIGGQNLDGVVDPTAFSLSPLPYTRL